MAQIKWKKIVTRETTLLERYLRMIGYANGVGAISRLKVGNILTVSNDCISEQYFDEKEIKNCAVTAVKEFNQINQSKLLNHFGSILIKLISFVDRLQKMKRFSTSDLMDNLNTFIALYGYGRGIILYGHFAEDALEKRLKENLALKTSNVESVYYTLTSPVESYKSGGRVLGKYYKPKVRLRSKQQKIINGLGLNPETKKIVRHLQWLSYYHELAERVTSECFGELNHILQSISARTHVNISDLKFYIPEEVGELLRNNSRKSDKNINERKEMYVLFMSNGNIKLLHGKRAYTYAKRALPREKIIETNIIAGQIAQSGKIRGVVKIVKKLDEIKKMRTGNVLVAPMTTPRLMDAVMRAKAIVTDEGGITSHAAIISRELGIPCIIGTKIATKVLKDGDVVEVDANKGVVTIVKKA